MWRQHQQPASSALAAPSAELVSQVTTDKTALAQALSAAQAIDLSQQAPEVAEGFVELFVRASALLEQTGAAQAELDALTQELQQATVVLTAELPTAVGTPVEVVEADAFLPTVIEEETPAVAEREAEVAFLSIVPPKPIYPASQFDFTTRTGARIDILTPDGQSMYSEGVPEAVDGGNGVNISRKVRIIVPEGATNQEITVNLGDQLTFLAGGALRVGDLFVYGQRVTDNRTVTPKSVIYRPTIAPATIEFDVIFNVAPLSDNLRVLGLNSDPNLTATRVRQEALTTGGFVETLPLSVNYRFQVNEKQSEMTVGFNTLYFSKPISKSVTTTTGVQFPNQEMIDATHLPSTLKRTNNLLTSVNVLPNLADVFGPLYPEGTTFEWRPNEHFEGVAGIADYGAQPENFATPHIRQQYNKIISYTATLPDGTVLKRRFANVQVTGTKALEVKAHAEPDAKKMLTESEAFLTFASAQNGIIPTDNNTTYEWTVKPDTTIIGHQTGVITVRTTDGSRTLSSEYWVTVTVVPTPTMPGDVNGLTPDPTRPQVPAILYSTSNYDYTNKSGARADILTPDGQAMGLSEALNGGNGINISRKVRVTMPAGASNQEITVNLGEHLTFINGSGIRVGNMTIDGQPSTNVPSVTKNSITYRPETAGGTVEFDVIFNVERNVQNLQVLGLSSDADATNSRLRQDAIAVGGFVETRPLLITYLYTINGKQSELKAGINTLYFPTSLTNNQQTQAEVYQPTAVASGVTLGANDRPDPAQFVSNCSDLPNDTRYEFTEPVTALISGTSKLVGVKVTFADGSVSTVYTLLKVRATLAQQYTPEAQILRLNRGASLRPVDFIKNASSLPADTRYGWVQEPSTRVAGAKMAIVVITYSDGSTDTITVRFTVR